MPFEGKSGRERAGERGKQQIRHGVARVLSKLGYCSRSQAHELVRAGRVTLNGRVVMDPEARVMISKDRLRVDGVEVGGSDRCYIALNKPRGLVVSASDERGRETVFKLLSGQGFGHLFAVGRLDMASEGLLFVTNDTAWAARVAGPESCVKKIYHVQVAGVPTGTELEALQRGVESEGEFLAVSGAKLIRSGGKTAWVELILTEGRNRHLRRMLGVLGYEVLRLVRVAIGAVQLGDLGKGDWRHLEAGEVGSFLRGG